MLRTLAVLMADQEAARVKFMDCDAALAEITSALGLQLPAIACC